MRITWSSGQARHIGTRSARYGANADDLHIEWVDEAVNDPDLVVDPVDIREPYKRRVTGYSPSYGGLITIIYLDLEGDYHGITAYPTS